jgi:hypothetical protein
MEEHIEYCKTVKYESERDSKYIFAKTSDAAQKIIITTLLFDVPHFVRRQLPR